MKEVLILSFYRDQVVLTSYHLYLDLNLPSRILLLNRFPINKMLNVFIWLEKNNVLGDTYFSTIIENASKFNKL